MILLFAKASRTIKSKKREIWAVSLITCMILLIKYRQAFYIRYYYGTFYIDQDAVIKQEMKNYDLPMGRVEFFSKCKCRKDQLVLLSQKTDEYVVEVKQRARKNSKQSKSARKLNYYSLDRERFEQTTLTCDMYNSLRRGPNQRVIAYSLYGTNPKYYKYLRDIVVVVRERYPGWIVRVYHDSSILPEFVCEMECLSYADKKKPDRKRLLDIVDFCDIERLPYDPSKTFNTSYMHGIYFN